MSNRNVAVLSLGKNILFSNIPRSVTVRIDNKLKIKLIKNSNKPLLSPQNTDYTNFVCKRNFGSDKKALYYRDFYDEKVEKLVNEQINLEFVASYTYLGLANYYGRPSVALPGLFGFYMKMFYEEQGHAVSFIKYQNLRGGSVILQPINPVQDSEFPDILDGLNRALILEKSVKQKLRELYKSAVDANDTDVQNMLDPYIAEQETAIYEFSRLYTRANELTCTEVGKYLFDRELHETHVKENPGKCTADVGPKLYM